MTEKELVIKLNEDIAQGIIDGENDAPRNIVRAFQATIADAIKNGTPLPKGHGRLKDVDWIDDNCALHHSDEDGSWCYTWEDIDSAPTVIKADKEGSE